MKSTLKDLLLSDINLVLILIFLDTKISVLKIIKSGVCLSAEIRLVKKNMMKLLIFLFKNFSLTLNKNYYILLCIFIFNIIVKFKGRDHIRRLHYE